MTTFTYFAYGSNMDSARLRARVKDCTTLDTAKLSGYGLRFHKRSNLDGTGKCNAFHTGNPDDFVQGVLFDVAQVQRPALDRAEGAGKGYYAAQVEVQTKNGPVQALTYLANADHIADQLVPTTEYFTYVMQGAREHGLPEDYIANRISVFDPAPNFLFDPAAVPTDVVSAKGVAHVNWIVHRLRARRIDRLEIQEPDSRFRTSNMIRAYNQAHLRRCLMFMEAAHALVYSGRGLVALSAIRSIYETVANFLHFESALQALLAEGDLVKIYDFVRARAYATRLPDLVKNLGAKEAVSVLTQIDKMKAVLPNARDDYDYLCEHTHPNAFGGILYFGNPGNPEDIIRFTDSGPGPNDDLKWVLVGGNLLMHFEQALDRIAAQLPALSEKGRQEAATRTDKA